MKKINLFIAAASTAMLCGCVSERVVVQGAPPPVHSSHAPIRMTTQANANFSVTDEANAKLRVAFRWNAAEKSFCKKLAERLAGKVVLDKADILLNAEGDVLISLEPEFELLDKSGNYYRINCNQIAVKLYSAQKIYAVNDIELAPLPRKLGIHKAKEQYLTPAVNALEPFIRKELDKISGEQIAVSIVDFSLANVQEQPDSEYIAVQVNRISNILRSTGGIIKFTNIRQDVSKAKCSFRVVYMKDRFPQGITNVLNLKLANK